MKFIFFHKCLLPLVFTLLPFLSQAFGVLTHEAIIDAAWDNSILPLLKKKYPASTEEDLKTAHAYAYGGAVTPDMGYYPRGSQLFTDLVHYVRSGDMASALLKNASNLNEFAFALGYLSHYNADKYGHPLATNIAVPLVYKKMKEKYGTVVTYEENEVSHMRMEFGFDVLEVAKGNYASQSYREFIGFKVDTNVLSKAFKEVYGLDINAVHDGHFSGSVETFRWVVANIFPLLTRQAWATKRKTILEADSTATAAGFRYKMRKKIYDKNFGTGYKRPGFFPWMFSWFVRILPKVGPLRALKFKAPTAEAEKYFIQSFDTVLFHYTGQISVLKDQRIELADIDFDTGKPTTHCEYNLADATYRSLLLAWQKNSFKEVTKLQRQDALDFFKGAPQTNTTDKSCVKFYAALEELRHLN